MTFTTPEAQASSLEQRFGAHALREARMALRFHRVNKNEVSAQFWTHTIFVLKQKNRELAA